MFGEGEARRRSIATDPQIKKALELAPKAELLLRDAPRFVAEHEGERKVAVAHERTVAGSAFVLSSAELQRR